MLDRRLHHIIAVARHGSFTKAAEAVGISQSGITKSVADLEAELGFALFHRTARGAVITEDGREFVERARRLLDDARTLLAGKRGSDDPYAQSLRVGICPASLEWLLSVPLAALLQRHPSIRFELVASSFERVVQLLHTGSVDVAVGFDDAFAEWGGEIKRVHLSTLVSVLFVRLNHPILDRPSVSEIELGHFDFVVPSDSKPYGSVIRSLYDEVGDWQRHLHIIDYFPTVRRIVATSNAIGVTTRDFSRSDAFQDTFASIDSFNPLPPAELCCAYRARWEPNPAVRAFLRVMREQTPKQL